MNIEAAVSSNRNRAQLPAETAEAFAGLGILGVTFDSGHILGLRDFPRSTLGEGYMAIWHRDPEGNWQFFQSTSPEEACPRYFGRGAVGYSRSDIAMEWLDERRARITVRGDHHLEWTITVGSSTATRLMSRLSSILPGSLFTKGWFLKGMEAIAGPLLGVDRISMHGKTSNGQDFLVIPTTIWPITDSAARLDGEDFGHPAPLPEQAKLGEFWIPQRGLLATGSAQFSPTPEDVLEEIKRSEPTE